MYVAIVDEKYKYNVYINKKIKYCVIMYNK